MIERYVPGSYSTVAVGNGCIVSIVNIGYQNLIQTHTRAPTSFNGAVRSLHVA